MNSFFSIFKKYLPVYMISTVLLIGLIAPYIVGDNVYKLNYKNRLKPPSYEHFVEQMLLVEMYLSELYWVLELL